MAPPRKFPSTSNSGTSSPSISLAEEYSFTEALKPFKNPNYKKNNTSGGVGGGRRSKSIKQTLLAERERGDRFNKEMRERRDREMMLVDGTEVVGEGGKKKMELIDCVTYASSEAPPSIIPPKKYCDVTGLEAPYIDPRSTLRYHNVEIYEVIKTFQPGVIQSYLAVRGNGVVLR